MQTITVFKPYPLVVGQKIAIEGGPRKGDWEVSAISERKVTLKCPVSGRTFEWNRFCYYAQDRQQDEWPRID